MSDGYLIGSDLLGRIYDTVDGGDGGTRRPTSGPHPGKQPTYVKVTGAAVSGWHPGHAYTFATGGDITHAADVEVKGANGETLTTNKIYLALRTGPKSDGTPRFIAQVGVGGTTKTETLLSDITCSGGSMVKTYKTITYIDPT